MRRVSSGAPLADSHGRNEWTIKAMPPTGRCAAWARALPRRQGHTRINQGTSAHMVTLCLLIYYIGVPVHTRCILLPDLANPSRLFGHTVRYQCTRTHSSRPHPWPGHSSLS